MTAHLAVLPHHYKNDSAIDYNYTYFHSNIVTATIGVALKLNRLADSTGLESFSVARLFLRPTCWSSKLGFIM